MNIHVSSTIHDNCVPTYVLKVSFHWIKIPCKPEKLLTNCESWSSCTVI